MSTFDVRNSNQDNITKIVFADDRSEDGYVQACTIEFGLTHLEIYDGADSVIINSKQHALDLIKAIEKAIELGWVK